MEIGKYIMNIIGTWIAVGVGAAIFEFLIMIPFFKIFVSKNDQKLAEINPELFALSTSGAYLKKIGLAKNLIVFIINGFLLGWVASKFIGPDVSLAWAALPLIFMAPLGAFKVPFKGLLWIAAVISYIISFSAINS